MKLEQAREGPASRSGDRKSWPAAGRVMGAAQLAPPGWTSLHSDGQDLTDMRAIFPEYLSRSQPGWAGWASELCVWGEDCTVGTERGHPPKVRSKSLLLLLQQLLEPSFSCPPPSINTGPSKHCAHSPGETGAAPCPAPTRGGGRGQSPCARPGQRGPAC